MLLFCFAIDDDPVQVWRLGDPCPKEIKHAVKEKWQVRAVNAEFEWGMLTKVATLKYGWPLLQIDQFYCVAAKAAYYNLPRALGPLSQRLNLPPEWQIIAANKVIGQTCKPWKGNKIDWENGTFKETSELMEALVQDCIRDVEAERYIDKLLPDLPESERELWLLHQRINERGVPIDLDMVNGGCQVLDGANAYYRQRLALITDGDITSPDQNKAIAQLIGVQSVAADKVAEILKRDDLTDVQREVLEIKQTLSFAATKKYVAARSQQVDGRLRGQYVFYGAGPGRWTATGVQPANFKRLPKKFPADQVAEVMAKGSFALMSRLYTEKVDDRFVNNAVKKMSQAVRPMVCAGPGKKLVGADLSAIEARGCFWLADDAKGLKMFREFDAGSGQEPYVIMAAEILECTFDKVDSDGRQLGKVGVLSCIYRQGAAALAGKYNLTTELSQRIVNLFRIKHKPVVNLWKALDAIALECVGTGQPQEYIHLGYEMWNDFLVMHLPSKRDLFYHLPKIEEGRFGDVVTYAASRSKKGARKDSNGHFRLELHGGVATENATQAICRDIFVHGMWNAEYNDLPTVLHTYDNLVSEVSLDDNEAADRQHSCMIDVPEWATGFPVAASKELDGRRYAK